MFKDVSSGSYDASIDHEHVHGLITIMAFLTSKNFQAFFHALSAPGIRLSELFACFKAKILSEFSAPMPLARKIKHRLKRNVPN